MKAQTKGEKYQLNVICLFEFLVILFLLYFKDKQTLFYHKNNSFMIFVMIFSQCRKTDE